MKASTYIKTSVALVSLLVISACSGKSREGGEAGAPAGGPPAPIIQNQGVGGDSYDNSQGMNPLSSIKGSPIRNVTLSLVDASGTSSGYYSRTVLSFDGQGLLSSASAIDVSAFSSTSALFGANHWSQYNQYNQQPTQQPAQQIVNFIAKNIGYSFNPVTGDIRISNFIAGSAVTAPAIQGTIPGAGAGRMAILISGVNYKHSSGRIMSFKSMSSRPYIAGRLPNLENGEMLDPNSSPLNIQSLGFNLMFKVGISSGTLSPVQNLSTNYVNGSFQTVQGTREVYMSNYGSNSFVFMDPVLDPRVQ